MHWNRYLLHLILLLLLQSFYNPLYSSHLNPLCIGNEYPISRIPSKLETLQMVIVCVSVSVRVVPRVLSLVLHCGPDVLYVSSSCFWIESLSIPYSHSHFLHSLTVSV